MAHYSFRPAHDIVYSLPSPSPNIASLVKNKICGPDLLVMRPYEESQHIAVFHMDFQSRWANNLIIKC